ncbi:MAG: WYL domain-containing protein, partial [Chitinivibrionales bacterium]|nr:WYL domain-containing protein [Chitinivibrionales bacterium]
LCTALAGRQKLRITYRTVDHDNPVERTICPVKLILFKQELYFICISERHENRDYYIKLCRIVSAELLDETFTVGEKRIRRIQNRLSKSFGILDEDVPKPQKIMIKFPYYFQLILNERRFHASQKTRVDKDGDVILTMDAPVDRELIQWVLGWSESATVIKPKALKDKLRALGRHMVSIY